MRFFSMFFGVLLVGTAAHAALAQESGTQTTAYPQSSPYPSAVTQEPYPATVCPQDAMRCPDGSFVGRIGPDCRFAPCPFVAQPSGTLYPQPFPQGSVYPQPQPSGAQPYQPQSYQPPQGWQPQPGTFQGPAGPGGNMMQGPPPGGEGPWMMQGGPGDDERRLADMQRGIKMMAKELKRVEKRLRALEKQGVPVSAEAKDILAKAQELVTQASGAQDAEDLDALPLEDMGDMMQSLNEEWQKAEMASRFPKMLKDASRELKRLQTAFAKAEKKSQSLKVSADSLLEEWRSVVGALTETRDKAKQLFESGQREEAVELLRDGFFEELEAAFEKQRAFEMLSNVQRGVKDGLKRIASYEKRVARLKAKKVNVAELEALIAEGKAKIEEVKAIAAQPQFDPESLIDAIEESQDIEMRFNDAFAAITGGGEAKPALPAMEGFKPVMVPDNFGMFQKGGEGMPQGPMPQQGAPGEFQPGMIWQALKRAFWNIRF